MSETEKFLEKSGEGFQDIAKALFAAVTDSLNTLCNGKLAFGEPSLAAGSKESLPEKLPAPFAVVLSDVSGDVAGTLALVVGVATARALAALMMGNEPSEEAEQPGELSADDLDAFRELGANASSAAGTALRSALDCGASIAVKSAETAEDAGKLLDLTGEETVFVFAEGTTAEKETALLLACGTDLCQAAVEKTAALAEAGSGEAEAAPVEAPKARLPENVERILKIPVPLIVVLAEKKTTFSEAVNLAEGSVIEFDKSSAEPLDLLVNNRKIGHGKIFKVGERFGLRIDEIGSPQQIVEKLG